MRVESTEIERMIVDMHGKVSAQTAQLFNISHQLTGIQERQDHTNGGLAEVKSEQLVQQGAISMFKWLFSSTIAVMGVGVAVASVILGIVLTTGR